MPLNFVTRHNPSLYFRSGEDSLTPRVEAAIANYMVRKYAGLCSFVLILSNNCIVMRSCTLFALTRAFEAEFMRTH